MTPYGREGEEFALAAVGDAIVTRRLSAADYPGLDALRERIRAADAGLANLEVVLAGDEHPPAAESGGTYLRGPPAALDDLDWLGFDLLAAATNHTGDFGVGGMTATMDALDDRGWAYAGLGEHLAAARAPAYVDTPAGRVALVACCSTVVGGAAAGRQRPDVRGRPGLAPLRLRVRHVVPEEEIESLRALSERLGLEAEKDRRRERAAAPADGGDGFVFYDVGGSSVRFEAADDDAEAEYGVDRRIVESDAAALLDRVRAARRQADWVLVSVHAHEGRGPRRNDATTPRFLRGFARYAVEAGADAVLGHGPHVLRGVEVYEGAPICYSLGNFVAGNETVERLPAALYDRFGLDPLEALPADLFDALAREDGDPEGARSGFAADRAFYESVVALPRWTDGELARVEFLPVELGFEAPRPQRGRPRPADGDRAAAILDRLADRSERFGTDVRVEDGVGVVEP